MNNKYFNLQFYSCLIFYNALTSNVLLYINLYHIYNIIIINYTAGKYVLAQIIKQHICFAIWGLNNPVFICVDIK